MTEKCYFDVNPIVSLENLWLKLSSVLKQLKVKKHELIDRCFEEWLDFTQIHISEQIQKKLFKLLNI